MKKNTKKTYLTPQVKVVSFKVEGGFVNSPVFTGEETNQLQDLQNDNTDMGNIFGSTL